MQDYEQFQLTKMVIFLPSLYMTCVCVATLTHVEDVDEGI